MLQSRTIRNYFKVGLLLHVMGGASVVSAVFLGDYLVFSWTEMHLASQFFLLWLFSFFLSNAVFSQLDARSRYQNFKQFRDLIYINGFQTKIAATMVKSSCQRAAAIHAANETGWSFEIKLYFKELGYRWFHILPDFVWKKPQFLLHPHFWRSTFFVKYYEPRFEAEIYAAPESGAAIDLELPSCSPFLKDAALKAGTSLDSPHSS